MDSARHATNQRWWDDVTAHHVASKFYDVDAFLAGKSSLLPLELAALPPEAVKGKRLLHLQCHFGLDTLSFARLGAEVVGVDFSAKAVAQATDLAGRIGLSQRARFVQADVLQWERHAQGDFDIVFTSYGVLSWLSDLKPWARGIAASLKPGGQFYLAEVHPLVDCMEDGDGLGGKLMHPTFDLGRAHGADQGGQDYATSHVSKEGSWFWVHPTSEVITCLLEAGLELRAFAEHPYCCYAPFKGMLKREDGYWELPPGNLNYPMLYEVKAVRP